MTDELGVDGLILAAYAVDDPKRIALLRVHHASENAQMSLYACANAVVSFLENPAGCALDDMMTEEIQRLASRLSVLSGELLKSLPALSKKGPDRAERTDSGLRGDPQPTPSQSGESPRSPESELDDWGDVPF